jgi:chromosome segregation ATPase
MASQIIELEDARSELLDSSSKDKSIIHELNVSVRRLELSEAGLKERLKSFETEEKQFQRTLHIAELRTQDFEQTLSRLQDEERTLKARILSQQHDNTELKVKYDNTIGTLQQKELQWKSIVDEHVNDKVHLHHTISELTNSVKKLEEAEFNLKCELREYQSKVNSYLLNISELNDKLSSKDTLNLNLTEELSKERNRADVLDGRIIELEKSLDKKELERLELERVSHSLKNALHRADDDKTELLKALDDLKHEKEKSSDEMNRLKQEVNLMVENINNATNKAAVLEDWLNETKTTYQREERVWTDRLLSYEDNEKRLRQRLLELEFEVSSFDFAQ